MLIKKGVTQKELKDISLKAWQKGLDDMLKIENIEQTGEQLEVFLRNVDDDRKSTMKFDNFKHFLNTFEKHGD